MKFELKTENENYLKSISKCVTTFSFLVLLVVCFDIALKLGIISRNYQLDYNCMILSVEKSKSNFSKLSRLSNLKSKQRILEFCREVVK